MAQLGPGFGSPTTGVSSAPYPSDHPLLVPPDHPQLLRLLPILLACRGGKKISEEVADVLIEYADNVIVGLLAKLPAGETCHSLLHGIKAIAKVIAAPT